MKAVAPDGTPYEVALSWIGSSLGRPHRVVRRWWRRIGRHSRPDRLGDGLTATDALSLFDELPGFVVAIVAVVLLALAVLVVVPLVAFLVGVLAELSLLLLALPLIFLVKVLAGDYWSVEVRCMPAETVVWSERVTGFRKSGVVEREIGAQLLSGVPPNELSSGSTGNGG